MILGGEQPVELPTMRWYDNDAFKMYIAALKDDYDKNLEEQKDFLDKYIDMAATDKDREYMANDVIKPIINFVNNNPDAIRSVEGRMQMRQLRNSINPEAIGKIKGTAKMADTYNKIKAELSAKGLFSEELEKASGTSLKDWNSVKDGVFDKAPTIYKTMNDLTDQYVDGIKPRFIEQVGQFGRKMGITDKDLKEPIQAAINDITNTPQGKYYLRMYNGDQNKLIDALVAAQGKRKTEDIVVDEVAKAAYDAKIKTEELNLEKQKTQATLAKLYGRDGSDDGTYSANKDMLDRAGEKLISGGYDAFGANVNKRMQTQLLEFIKNDKILRKFKKGTKQYNDRLKFLEESVYKKEVYHRTREWVKNTSGKSLDDLSVTIGGDLYLQKIRSLGSPNNDGYYIINPKQVKVYTNSDMINMKNGHSAKQRNFENVVMYKPSQDLKALPIIGKDGNIYTMLKMVNSSGETRWINTEGSIDLNRGVGPEQDQKVLQKLGLKKQTGTVNNR